MGKIDASNHGEILTLRASGPLTADEVVGAINERYPGMAGSRVLWDLSAADMSGQTQADFARIASAARNARSPGKHFKTAFVVADAQNFAKQWRYINQAFTARVPVEYAAFRDRGSAERWLLER